MIKECFGALAAESAITSKLSRAPCFAEYMIEEHYSCRSTKIAAIDVASSEEKEEEREEESN